jgi:hypothetical protein
MHEEIDRLIDRSIDRLIIRINTSRDQMIIINPNKH